MSHYTYFSIYYWYQSNTNLCFITLLSRCSILYYGAVRVPFNGVGIYIIDIKTMSSCTSLRLFINLSLISNRCQFVLQWCMALRRTIFAWTALLGETTVVRTIVASPTRTYIAGPSTTRPRHDDVMTSWWRHQMETLSALLALYARNSPVTGEFPSQRPVTRSFDIFFDLRQTVE